ncbi:hypothetical protein [Methanocaldococcus fervens]|uniref:Uncharacterized protein n=1 Tax=Methanocaldococcus fervens (strain DSM 4213 / JCM 15782 / AG86) TaxID=573064 RepID=C7P595_METFA|nr:hypothetical protein [Methanocaldococcus fervens]ACV25273.1 hypothetical protein Mefer_1469 [Methanocaldococcus fervens AG86]
MNLRISVILIPILAFVILFAGCVEESKEITVAPSNSTTNTIKAENTSVSETIKM